MSGALLLRPGGPNGSARHAGPPGSGGNATSSPAFAVLAAGDGCGGTVSRRRGTTSDRLH